jgi:hypothetical protein
MDRDNRYWIFGGRSLGRSAAVDVVSRASDGGVAPPPDDRAAPSAKAARAYGFRRNLESPAAYSGRPIH